MSHRNRTITLRGCCAVCLLASLLPGRFASAQSNAPWIAKQVTPTKAFTEYRSKYLLVFTNLPPAEAKKAIENLERTLSHAAKYWGQEPRGKIECYLVHNVDDLPEEDLPHPLARILISGVGGVTLPNRGRNGNSVRNTPIILASTKPRIAEHEIVHAYCTQTFGFTGPDWYSEGMAEMVVHQGTRGSGVQWPEDQIQLLRESRDVTIQEVLAGGKAGQRIFESLNAMLANPKNQNRNVPWSDWQAKDADNVQTARQEYLRCWALCYLLLHNSNYSPRFRMLGKKHVTEKDCQFAKLFGSVQQEIDFEYSFFLQNICLGYRVDLCCWDWAKRFQPLEDSKAVTARIAAGKGFQPTGLTVIQGQKYRFVTEGTWSTDRATRGLGAGPAPRNRNGELAAVIMREYKLSEPMHLDGAEGVFVSPYSGNLYLRCRESWSELHDNDGHLTVRLQRVP